MEKYRYFAFISYNSKDVEWGKRLQRKLESYRLPSTLCSKHNLEKRPIKPVFFAPTDIQPGGLTAELQERLKAARHLIVICSPNSAKSQWVAKEIEFFHSLGRSSNIHFFIVAGEPHSGNPDTECFNPVVDELGIPEILGANVNEKVYRWPWLNKERAYVQLVTKLLGIEFDSIWQRHKRQLIYSTVMWAISLLAVLAIILFAWQANYPRDVEVTVNDTFVNSELPAPENIIVTLELENEERIDTVPGLEHLVMFKNIPAKFFNGNVRIGVRCGSYLATDTTVLLEEKLNIAIRRDPAIYGDVHFYVKDESGEVAVPGVEVEIAGIKAVSAADGLVEFKIPLEKQRRNYAISSSAALMADTLYMPCNPNSVIRLK